MLTQPEIRLEKGDRHLPPSLVEVWNRGNILYPQTFTGITTFVAPYLLTSLMEGRLDAGDLWSVTIDQDSAAVLAREANEVHRRCGIAREVRPHNIQKIWRNTKRHFISNLTSQINILDTQVIKQGLVRGLSGSPTRHATISHFLTNPSYRTYHSLIFSGWESVELSLKAHENKASAANISAHLIRMAQNNSGTPDLSHLKVINPAWDQIRVRTAKDFASRVDTSILGESAPVFIHAFINNLVVNNVPQSASLGRT